MAEGATIANAFVQVMPSMEGATTNITNALVPGMTSAGESAGSKFSSVFSGKAGAALKIAGGALAGVFAVGAMKDAFETVEAGFNNVKLATGATGEQAESLKKTYLEVSKNVSGSFEDIGSAVGELNTRFGLQDEALEAASEQAMKYAKVTGQDATTAIQDVSRMMNNAGISADDYGKVLDTLTVAGQAAGVDVGKLTNTVTDNAASFKELGFSTEESIAMLANFEKTGANTSGILAGMKKGVAAWTKEGKSAKEGFAEFVSGVEDGSISAQDAIDIFGSKAGVTMYDAAQKGQLSFDDMYKAITEDSQGALDDVYMSTLTAQEKFDILGKNLQAGFYEILDPLVTAIMPYVDDVVSGLSSLISGAVTTVKPFFEKFMAFVKPILETTLPELQSVFEDVMGTIKSIISDVWPTMQTIITTVMQVVSSLIKTAWPVIKQIIIGAMEGIKVVIETVWPIIQTVITVASEVITKTIKGFSELVSGVKKTFDDISQFMQDPIGKAQEKIVDLANDIGEKLGFDGVGDKVNSIFDNIGNFMEDPIGNAQRAISDAGREISDVLNFSGLSGTVSSIFSGIESAMADPVGTAKQLIDDAVSSISSIFSELHLELPSIALPHFYVWGGEFPFGIGGEGSPPEFEVNWWAKGGFADEATLNVYGEKGPELYWPGYEPYFDKYAKGIAEHMPYNGVIINIEKMEVRKDSDIRLIADELNMRINRQAQGAIA